LLALKENAVYSIQEVDDTIASAPIQSRLLNQSQSIKQDIRQMVAQVSQKITDSLT
jgi:hypothetical protein